MAPIRRAQGGSSPAMASSPADRSNGRTASSSNAADVTTIASSSDGRYSTVTPSPMAMGRARPRL